MRRYLLVLLLVLVTSMTVSADPREEMIQNDIVSEPILFRGFEWGTSLEEIQKAEIQPGMVNVVDYYTNEEAKSFTVVATVSTIEMFATFEFDDDWGLIDGTYTLKEKRETPLDNYSCYEILDTLLTTKYGEPTLGYYIGLPDDLAKLQTEEIVGAVLNNGAGIIKCWVDENMACIMTGCVAEEGNITPILLYCQDYERVLNLITSLYSTDGL